MSAANDERNRRLGRGEMFFRIALARAEHLRLRETHVVVGDHPPERRCAPEPRVIYPGQDQCASHAPARDPRDVYVVPASASHGPR